MFLVFTCPNWFGYTKAQKLICMHEVYRHVHKVPSTYTHTSNTNETEWRRGHCVASVLVKLFAFSWRDTLRITRMIVTKLKQYAPNALTTFRCVKRELSTFSNRTSEENAQFYNTNLIEYCKCVLFRCELAV